MSVLTDIWRQLVRRRLWPVALLLVAAIAAVPLLLAKEPEPTVDASVPPAPATAAASELVEAPIVTASEEGSRVKGRKVLGKQRDIFKSTAKKPKAAKAAEPTGGDEEPAQEKPAESPAEQPSTGGGGSPATSAPTAPATPAPKPKTYPANSLSVRFGSADSDLAKSTLPKTEGAAVGRAAAAHLHGPAEGRQDRSVPARRSASAQRRRRVPPDARELRDDPSAGRRDRVLRRGRRGRHTTAQFQLDLLKIHKANADGAKAPGSPGSRASTSAAAAPPARSAASAPRSRTR